MWSALYVRAFSLIVHQWVSCPGGLLENYGQLDWLVDRFFSNCPQELRGTWGPACFQIIFLKIAFVTYAVYSCRVC